MRREIVVTGGRLALGVCTITMVLVLPAAPVAADTYLLCAEPNDLRWDLADSLKFVWKSAEFSIRAVNPAGDEKEDPRASGPRLTVSAKRSIYVSQGRLVIDVANPVVFTALDENGQSLSWQEYPPGDVRQYRRIGYDSVPSSMTVELPLDPNRAVPLSVSSIKGFLYALYVDAVIEIDVPYDPDGGWLEFEAAPDLLVRVEPHTPHPPGPLEYEPMPPELIEPPYDGWRVESVGLYSYSTRLKSKTQRPVMALEDVWYPPSFRALVNYVVIETQLFDSKHNKCVRFPTGQWAGTGVPSVGVVCFGETRQDENSYDTIRHVVGVHPVEVKIPFVLTNIPVPSTSSGGK